MSSVFVIISETMPVNGTYPASGIESVWLAESDAQDKLYDMAINNGADGYVEHGDTVFYATVDQEKYEYIEYRIEEHTVQAGE